MRRPVRRLLLAALAAITLSAAPGCGKARCTAEITDGTATYKGAAEGKKGQLKLDRDAIRDACRQMCAAQKAPVPDACAARCAADVDGAKIGAKTSCSDR
ncbi:MAG: hypothetical protein IT372_26380 [Polyangiaceae bacterium]|nr:hypothetical protein [Polyangiaceae bacterium]